MIVDINDIERCLRYFKAINAEALEDIVWMRGDEKLTPDPDVLEEYRFIGLSNRDFPSVAGWLPDDTGIRVATLTLTKAPTPEISGGTSALIEQLGCGPNQREAMQKGTLAHGAALNADTWADFVARLHYDCVGEGVKRHFTRDALFIVEAKKYTYGIDEDYGGEKVACREDTVFTSPEGYYESLDQDERDDLDDECKKEHDKPFMDLDQWDKWSVLGDQDGVTVTSRSEYWEYVNSHLTRDAADTFIERKKHDYRDGLRVNVEAQIYCWEFNAIKEAILAGRLVLSDEQPNTGNEGREASSSINQLG